MDSSQNNGKMERPDRGTVTTLFGTIGDTTWRMFVPTIGLTILGLIVDKWLHTRPWIMVVFMFAGAYLAYVLVMRQLQKVKQTNDK
jgi:Flp pilus assembly protein TadB